MRREEKSEEVDGVTCRYSSDWIHRLESEDHWRLYHRQASVMQGRVAAGDRVLEVGVGSGFMANYLKSKGVLVTTVDIDAEKRPDIVANVVTWDFGGEVYDHVLAFEVFEHIPYDRFRTALVRAAGACRRFLFMSVPSNERVWLRLQARVPRLRPLRLDLTTPRGAIPDGHHFWEVGYGPTTLATLDDTFDQAGFRRVHREKFLSRFYFVLERK